MNQLQQILSLSVLPVSLGLSIFSTLTRLALAEFPIDSHKFTHKWQISQLFIPPIHTRPKKSWSNTTRTPDTCQELVPLLPPNKLGLTFSDRPRFFWFIPSGITVKTADFLLQNEDNDTVYEITLNLSNQRGIIGFTLPDESPSLMINKEYKWNLDFTISCQIEEIDKEQIDEEQFISGWVKRIPVDSKLSKDLINVQPQRLSSVYTKNGIWYEAVNDLVYQRCMFRPQQDVINNWGTLLKSVGLNDLISAPLINSCNPKRNI